jgi:hypothetical protein
MLPKILIAEILGENFEFQEKMEGTLEENTKKSISQESPMNYKIL